MAIDYNSSSDINVLKTKKIIEYPIGISAKAIDEYGKENQYMMIKINTDINSATLKNDKGLGGVMTQSTRVGTGIRSSLLNAVENVTQNASLGFNNVTDKNMDPDIILKNSATDINALPWQTQKNMIRLDRVVILPMPDNYVVGTNIQYNMVDISFLTNIGDFINNIGAGAGADLLQYGKNAAISGLINGVKNIGVGGVNIGVNVANDILKNYISGKLGNLVGPGLAYGNVPGNIIPQLKIKDLTSLKAQLAEDRVAMNPKKEIMFDSFGFRSFQFIYSFAPKDKYESESVNEIIQTLRYYALPEISGGKMFYKFPAEFEVFFMLGQKDNPNIPKMTTSVIESIIVQYSDGHVWSTLPNGSPVNIHMTLQFKELELVDRNRVYNKTSSVNSGY